MGHQRSQVCTILCVTNAEENFMKVNMKMYSLILQKGHFNLGFYLTVSDCTVSAFRLGTLRPYQDVLFTKSTIYRPARTFQKWSCKVRQ